MHPSDYVLIQVRNDKTYTKRRYYKKRKVGYSRKTFCKYRCLYKSEEECNLKFTFNLMTILLIIKSSMGLPKF